MMSLEQIRSMSRARARKSAREGIVPLVIEEGDDVRGIPFIGARTPRGWRKVAEFFVDSTGWGAEDEPAMTLRAFTETVNKNPGYGWAITEAGQFQVYVTQFERIKK